MVNETQMVPKSKEVHEDASSSKTPTLAIVPVVEPISEQQDIPLVQVPLENPQANEQLDEEQVSETLLDLRHAGKRKAPTLKSRVSKKKRK